MHAQLYFLVHCCSYLSRNRLAESSGTLFECQQSQLRAGGILGELASCSRCSYWKVMCCIPLQLVNQVSRPHMAFVCIHVTSNHECSMTVRALKLHTLFAGSIGTTCSQGIPPGIITIITRCFCHADMKEFAVVLKILQSNARLPIS